MRNAICVRDWMEIQLAFESRNSWPDSMCLHFAGIFPLGSHQRPFFIVFYSSGKFYGSIRVQGMLKAFRTGKKLTTKSDINDGKSKCCFCNRRKSYLAIITILISPHFASLRFENAIQRVVSRYTLLHITLLLCVQITRANIHYLSNQQQLSASFRSYLVDFCSFFLIDQRDDISCFHTFGVIQHVIFDKSDFCAWFFCFFLLLNLQLSLNSHHTRLLCKF